MHESPVLIVGAGPTGLVLGIELARRTIPFRLIDRLGERQRWSRAIFIKPRSLEIFASLGLIDAFLECGQIVRGVDLFSDDNNACGYRFGALDTPYPFILSLPQDQTERILNTQLEALGGRVERGVEFMGLEQSESTVQVRLRSETAGEEVAQFGWVVGADGCHSTVRSAINASLEGRDYPQLWGVVDAGISRWQHPREITCVQLQPFFAALFPRGEDRWRIYFRADSHSDEVLAEIAQRVAVMCPAAEFHGPEHLSFFHSESRAVNRFRSGRVLLAGDAAHLSNPFEAHGMNSGMQDAHNLGWKLACAVLGEATQTLIESYHDERQLVAQAVLKSGDQLETRVFETGDRGRQEFINFVSTTEGQQFAALAESELQYGYPESPIVAELGPAPASSVRGTKIGFRVGDAEDLLAQRGRFRLHELLAGAHHTLLFLLGDAGQPAVKKALSSLTNTLRSSSRTYAVLRSRTAPDPFPDNLLLDTEGKLHDRLALDGPNLCLIRPDGHLGFRCEPPSLGMLSKYLERLFLPNREPAHTLFR